MSGTRQLWQIPPEEMGDWVLSGNSVQIGPMDYEPLYERRTANTNARNAKKALDIKAAANAAALDKAKRQSIIGNKREIEFDEAGWRLPRYHLITDNGYFVPLSEEEWFAYKAAYPNDGFIKMSIDAGSELDDETYTLRRDYYRAVGGLQGLESFLKLKAQGYYPHSSRSMERIGLKVSQSNIYSPEYAKNLRKQAKDAVDKAISDLRAAFPEERLKELVPELTEKGGKRKTRRSRNRKLKKR